MRLAELDDLLLMLTTSGTKLPLGKVQPPTSDSQVRLLTLTQLCTTPTQVHQHQASLEPLFLPNLS